MEGDNKTTATTTPNTEDPKQQPAATTPQGAGTDPKQPEGGDKGDKGSELKYTDADVDAIIAKRFAKWEKQQEAKVAEAAKLAEMNAQEKAEYERDQLQKELDALKRKDAVGSMVAESRRQLKECGISVDDALIERLVGETAEETKASVDAFSESFTAAVDAAVKAKLAGQAPKAGVGAKAMTKEEIMAIKDTEQRQAAIREHVELFE
ncbi:MAG: DUF4355 domain-containing protein [Atopobiaceae bacterium]|nr:DUF4355 domain-containing protein [Atopobiaceae bacterium]